MVIAGLAGWEWAKLSGLESIAGSRKRARASFEQALAGARKQGAMLIELRATTALARLQHEDGQSDEAVRALENIYGKFSEGYDQFDVRCVTRV